VRSQVADLGRVSRTLGHARSFRSGLPSEMLVRPMQAELASEVMSAHETWSILILSAGKWRYISA